MSQRTWHESLSTEGNNSFLVKFQFLTFFLFSNSFAAAASSGLIFVTFCVSQNFHSILKLLSRK
jgi:hypothetical protein